MLFFDDDGPNSLLRSTLMMRIFPATAISTFFMPFPFLPVAFLQQRRLPFIPIVTKGSHSQQISDDIRLRIAKAAVDKAGDPSKVTLSTNPGSGHGG
jgi:hypothetical protein